MRVVLSWLRELCPTERSAEDLAELLAAKGAEVEAIDYPWERVSGIFSGGHAPLLNVPREWFAEGVENLDHSSGDLRSDAVARD